MRKSLESIKDIEELVITHYNTNPCLIEVRGPLNLFNAHKFYDEYLKFQGSNKSCNDLTIDFSNARTYEDKKSDFSAFDCSVVAILIQFSKEMENREGNFRFIMYEPQARVFRLRGANSEVKELKGLAKYLEVISE